MTTLKKFVTGHSNLAHTLVVIWGFLTGFYFEDPTAHTYIDTTAQTIYHSSPHWLQGLIIGLIIPLIAYWKTQKKPMAPSVTKPFTSSSRVAKLSVLIMCLAIFPTLTGCVHKVNAPLPNGAINTFDASSYETLMTAQATLNTLKVDEATLTADVPQFKTVLNQAISDYDVAEKAWQTYHAGNGTSTAVEAALATLTTDILKVQGIIPTGAK